MNVFKNRKDHNDQLELHHRLSEKENCKVEDLRIDIIENNVDSGYRGMLPDRIRFFYNDFTYDYFERSYSPFKSRKRKYNINVWNWTIGHYSQRIKKDLKDGQIDVEHYVNFPKKYKMRYKTKKKLKKDPTFFDETIAKKMNTLTQLKMALHNQKTDLSLQVNV